MDCHATVRFGGTTVATVAAGAVAGAIAAAMAPRGRRSVAAAPQPPMGSSKNAGASTHGSHTGIPRPAGGRGTAVGEVGSMRPKYPPGPARGKADPYLPRVSAKKPRVATRGHRV
jgi:hypothetical protein